MQDPHLEVRGHPQDTSSPWRCIGVLSGAVGGALKAGVAVCLKGEEPPEMGRG